MHHILGHKKTLCCMCTSCELCGIWQNTVLIISVFIHSSDGLFPLSWSNIAFVLWRKWQLCGTYLYCTVCMYNMWHHQTNEYVCLSSLWLLLWSALGFMCNIWQPDIYHTRMSQQLQNLMFFSNMSNIWSNVGHICSATFAKYCSYLDF
jgi:hypothetical protein